MLRASIVGAKEKRPQTLQMQTMPTEWRLLFRKQPQKCCLCYVVCGWSPESNGIVLAPYFGNLNLFLRREETRGISRCCCIELCYYKSLCDHALHQLPVVVPPSLIPRSVKSRRNGCELPGSPYALPSYPVTQTCISLPAYSKMH